MMNSNIDCSSIQQEGKRYREGQGGHIEKFEYQKDGSLLVAGWALCVTEPEPHIPVKLFIFCGSECICETSDFAQERPDLVTHFDLDPKASGKKFCAGFVLEFTPPDRKLPYPPALEFFSLSRTGHLYKLENPFPRCHLQLELTGRCNMRCPQCPGTIDGFNNRDLSVEESLLAEGVLSRATSMCIDGFGETLLARNFDEIVSRIPWTKVLTMHTNGVFLKKKLDSLLKYAPPFQQIVVSLDALSADLYRVMRPGGNLTTILDSMRELVRERQKRGQSFPKVVPNLTLSAQNVAELPAFIRLAKELDGILEITTFYDPAYSEAEKQARHDTLYANALPRLGNRVVHESFCHASEYAAEVGVELSIVGYTDGKMLSEQADELGSLVAKLPVSQCPLKTSASIQVDGKGMLCVWQLHPVFNWRKEGTMDPLQTERGRKVVSMLEQGIIPAECGGAPCPYVARRPSKEEYIVVEGEFAGGWQKS